MNLYKNKITCPITGTSKSLITVNYTKEEKEKEKTISVNQLHHIYILDRSGSMYRDINTLIDNVEKTLDVINEDDLITIIWFSSHNNYRTVVKGSKKSPGLYSIINTMRSVNGATCFSDPIGEVQTIVDELYPLCPNISVTLFTDGEAVVPWMDKEEYEKVYTIVDQIKDKILAFNTIGYGNYYNQEFLKKVSAISEFGEMAHSSKIDEYLEIFTRNFNTIEGMVSEGIELTANDCEITYLSRNFTKEVHDYIKLSRLDNSKNQFFILANDCSDFEITINGDTYNTKDISKEVSGAAIRNFFYSSAYNKYYTGNRYQSLQIVVKELGDKGLADSHITAFTFDETGKHMDYIRKSIFHPKSRYDKGSCGPDYIPAEDAYCVIDLLKDLGACGALFVPFGEHMAEYQRTTVKSVDMFNLFERTKERVLCGFDNFVFNEEFLNFSLKVDIPGTVKLNPKQAAKAGLDSKYKTKIFRNYSIIVDGRVNMPVIEAYVPQDAKNIELPVESILDQEIINDITYNHVVFDLGKFPVINKGYIDKGSNIDLLFKDARTLEKLKFAQKIVKDRIKQMEISYPSLQDRNSVHSSLTSEQIELLREHGITKDGIYAPIDLQKESKDSDNVDFYGARSLVFSFKGLSDIPPIKSTMESIAKKEKTGKALTIAQKFLKDASDNVDLEIGKGTPEVLYKAYLDMLKEIKAEIFQFRLALGTIKLAKILTGDWFAGLAIENDYYVYEKDGMILLVKPKSVKRYFSLS